MSSRRPRAKLFEHFGSIIVNSFGYNELNTIFLQMPSGGFQIVSVIIATYTASRVRKSRLAIVIVGFVLALLGILSVKKLPTFQA